MYIFMCVPVADHISAAIYRSRFGLLPACAAGIGERVRSRLCPSQQRGASPGCCTSEIRCCILGDFCIGKNIYICF